MQMQMGGRIISKSSPQGQIPEILDNTNLSVESKMTYLKECQGFFKVGR